MGNMKIWAYATKDKEYILDERFENKRPRLFFIWEALRMKRETTFEYNKLIFMSTHRNIESRQRMTPVIKGFFRYIENMKGNDNGGGGESLTHEFAILALSLMNSITVKNGDELHTYKFTELKIEDCKVQFENGNIYYPDLIGFLDPSDSMYEKWGGKVAIEVHVKHKCEPEKVRDFEDHGIPIIEITIYESIWLEKRIKGSEYSDQQLENYFGYIQEIFKQYVYGKVISNPLSPSFQKKLFKAFSQKFDSQNDIILEKETEISNIKEKIMQLNHQLKIANEKLSEKQKQVTRIEGELSAIRNRNFWQRLGTLF
jgi:hypothetical protein